MKRFPAWESLLPSLHTTVCYLCSERTKILRSVTCLFCLDVWSHTLGRLARIIQSRASNLILMKYCEKNTSTFLMHVRVSCSPWGTTSISMSRLLQAPKHHPHGPCVWSALPSFISKAVDRCRDGCDDGRPQPRGLTLASNNFSLIHHHHHRRRCSQSFTEPLTRWRSPEFFGVTSKRRMELKLPLGWVAVTCTSLQVHRLFCSSTSLLPEHELSLSRDQHSAAHIPFFPRPFPGSASACTCVCACVWKHNLGHYGGSCEKMWLKPSVNIAFG